MTVLYYKRGSGVLNTFLYFDKNIGFVGHSVRVISKICGAVMGAKLAVFICYYEWLAS